MFAKETTKEVIELLLTSGVQMQVHFVCAYARGCLSAHGGLDLHHCTQRRQGAKIPLTLSRIRTYPSRALRFECPGTNKSSLVAASATHSSAAAKLRRVILVTSDPNGNRHRPSKEAKGSRFALAMGDHAPLKGW